MTRTLPLAYIAGGVTFGILESLVYPHGPRLAHELFAIGAVVLLAVAVRDWRREA